MNRILQVLCVAVMTLSMMSAALAQSSAPTTWTRMPGTAVDISINIDGQAYVTASDGTPWRWDKVEQRWRRMSGKFVRITAAEGNRPWALNADGVVYRYNGLWWEDKDTDVADVAADTNGNVFIAKTNGEIKKWYFLRGEWRPFEGTAKRIALNSAGHPWAVTSDGRIRAFNGKTWTNLPGRALDIAMGGTDEVMIADAAGFLRRWNGAQQRWDTVAGVKDVARVAITPNGDVWVVLINGTIMANGGIVSEETIQEDTSTDPKAAVPTAPVNTAKVDTANVPTPPTPTAGTLTVTTPMPVGADGPEITGSSTAKADAGDPATITTKDKITFINTLKSASTLAIGADGSVFGLDSGGNVLRWSNTAKKFDKFPGTLVRIAVDNTGQPWGISALGRVFRHDGSRWKQILNATASDLSIGYDGTVLTATAGGQLYKLNAAQTRFDIIPGTRAVLIAAGPNGTPWVVRTDKLVQRCDVTPCKLYQQKAQSIAVGPDGSVWIVSDRSQLMRLETNGKFKQVQTPGHTPLKVAVGPNGFPWVVASNNIALASTYFERDEGGDRSTSASTSASGTTGSGTTGGVTSLSISSFIFSKSLKFETVSHSSLSAASCPDLEASSEGVVWAKNNGAKLEVYSAAKRKFVTEDTGFDNWDLDDYDLAPNGDVWALTLNPSTGLFRERNGTRKEYSVTGTTGYNDISVAADGTVYVVVFISGIRYLYFKAPNLEVFKKFSTFSGVRTVDIGPGGSIWIVDKDLQVRQWDGQAFVKITSVTFNAVDLAISKTNGTVYLIENSTSALHKWNAANKSFDKVIGTTVNFDSLAVDGDGRPWICNDTTPIIKRGK